MLTNIPPGIPLTGGKSRRQRKAKTRKAKRHYPVRNGKEFSWEWLTTCWITPCGGKTRSKTRRHSK
jgi:hypothetical protein